MAGIRYFQCEPLKGIFTRPSKLTRKVQAEDEADGLQTTHASRATSPLSTSTASMVSSSPATPSNIPHKSPQPTAKEPSAMSQISNLTKTTSESISNLSEAGSIKKGERELKIGDRVLETRIWSLVQELRSHVPRGNQVHALWNLRATTREKTVHGS